MVDNGEREGPPSEVKVNLEPQRLQAESPAPTTWRSCTFAREWFEDALQEARTGTDNNAKRREIVFAVCFAESYLFERVRDDVLNRDFQALDRYFPPGKWQRVIDKWKYVPTNLRKDGLIQATPNFGQPYWEDFKKLVKFRNGLVHAGSSRPETAGQDEIAKPVPSKDELDSLPVSWATEVVVKLVKELHKAVGTSPPGWLVMP